MIDGATVGDLLAGVMIVFVTAVVAAHLPYAPMVNVAMAVPAGLAGTWVLAVVAGLVVALVERWRE